MLTHLKIENVAVIEKIEIEFGSGFNCLTGETAAGKSIIIDSINMILGGRTSKDLIRTGSNKAVVQAIFSVGNEDIIVHREISTDGRNLCKVNGAFVTVAELRERVGDLINIHGQHDNQPLLNPNKHIVILDKFANNTTEKAEYTNAKSEYNDICKKLLELEQGEQDKLQRMDICKFQLNEIDEVNLQIGEDVQLEEKCEIASNIDGIIEGLSSSYSILYDEENSALDKISSALRAVEGLTGGEFTEIMERIAEYKEGITEVSHDINRLLDKYNSNVPNLDEIQERLHKIWTLKKKYGAEISDVLEYRTKLLEELDSFGNAEENIRVLKNEQNIKKKVFDEKIELLYETRKRAASKLKNAITKELEFLHMPKTTFDVNFKNFDNAEFLISTNVGESAKPLAKIASGGELSRISLAIMSILAKSSGAQTLIFDEIDTGISGRAAQAVAEKLAKMGKTKQIFSITHLAQIASMADNHYKIVKETLGGKTVSTIEKLDIEGRKGELARIIGGAKITDVTLAHAEEMLNLAGGK